MDAIPAVPPDSLNAERDFQADQCWHRFAFAILPPPFGNRELLDIGCGGGGVAAHGAGMGWYVTGIDIFRFWVKEPLEKRWKEAGLRLMASASYGYLPFVDTLTLHKARSGGRRAFPIGRRWESLFADRFVWLLAKTS